MAIRNIAQLKAWFARGKYPTAAQFSDVFDSFFHKAEKIPIDAVETLSDQLNHKYGVDEAKILEEQTRTALGQVILITEGLNKTYNSIAELETEDAQIRTDFTAADTAEKTAREGGDTATLTSAKNYTDGKAADLAAEDTKIRGEFAAADAQIREEYAAADAAEKTARQSGDAATLASAKTYADQSVATERTAREGGDATTLASAKSYIDQTVATEKTAREGGDATTLASAKTYTDQTVATEKTTRESGDATTLTSAKTYADQSVATEKTAREGGDTTTLVAAKTYADAAVAALVSGSPAALDTLNELAAALGDDPNFATTVMTEIGKKADKVAGKGFSTEDYSTAEKSKLAGIAPSANNYTHPGSHPATMIAEDVSHRFITDTERTAWNAKPGGGLASSSAPGLMSAPDKTKLDGVAASANNYAHPGSHPATMIAEDASRRFITDAERAAWNAKPGGGLATPSAAGQMSAADKAKLDGVAVSANNYTHPSNHPAAMITEDASHRFTTDAEKTAWNAKADKTAATGSAAGLMSAADKTKLDGLSSSGGGMKPLVVEVLPVGGVIVGGRAYYSTSNSIYAVTGRVEFPDDADLSTITVPANISVTFNYMFKAQKDMSTVVGTSSQFKQYTIQRTPMPGGGARSYIYLVNCSIYG